MSHHVLKIICPLYVSRQFLGCRSCGCGNLYIIPKAVAAMGQLGKVKNIPRLLSDQLLASPDIFTSLLLHISLLFWAPYTGLPY